MEDKTHLNIELESKIAELQWENELLKKRLELRGSSSEQSNSKIELSEDNELNNDIEKG